MEGSGTPTLQTESPPPPYSPAGSGDDKASGGMRALAILLALVVAFGTAVVIVVMVDIGDSPRCADVQTPFGPSEDCYDHGAAQEVIALILGWAGGILGAAAVLAGLIAGITGRGMRRFAQLTGGAVVLAALSIGVSAI